MISSVSPPIGPSRASRDGRSKFRRDGGAVDVHPGDAAVQAAGAIIYRP
jgi:hypothetical protein